jgi:TRAP-type uncharacterized transport system substrate-binding protein
MKFPLSGRYLFLISAAIAASTLVVGVSIFLSSPVFLRIAVGLPDGPDAILFQAVDQLLLKERAGLRLDIVNTAGIHESNVLLGKREVDLAVLRLDEPLPEDAGLVSLLRMNMAVIVAPGRKKIEKFPQLKGKRLGLVVRTSLDEASTAKLLDVFGMTPADVKLTVVKPEDVASWTKSGRLDAVMVFGTPVEPEVSSVVYAVDSRANSPPSIVPVDIGDFLNQNSAGVVDATIPKNAFSRRNIPDDDVDTVGVPTALAANKAVATGLEHIPVGLNQEDSQGAPGRRVWRH